MIQLDRVAKWFGDRVLFEDLSWQLGLGARIGLVGPNGAGKTTLFKMIAGEVETDRGRVVRPRDWTVGMLPQEVDTLEDRPLLGFVLTGRQDLLDLEGRIEAIHDELERARHEGAPDARVEALAHEQAECQDRFDHAGGYTFRARGREILAGMGFSPSEEGRSAAELSGGWRMRLLLARLLLQRPSILLMDEPTNHLDLPSLEWLETFLQSYEGTVVVISHDRYFLNRLVNEIAAFDVDGFKTFKGNYDAYEVAREQALEMLQAQKAQQDRKLKETERFVERFRYKASKARQVQSRVKQLEKIERIELPGERKRVHFQFPEGPRSGRMAAKLEHVAKRYGEVQVYGDLNLEIMRDERLALVGPNGHGKTTLLRLMAGDARPDGGRIELGHNILLGYYAQHQVDALNLTRNILEEMEIHATDETRPRCRNILGAFLFSGDDVYKPISVLSGGEKSRVALAKLLLRPSNFLLLDEPTNHLDMQSRDVLMEAMRSYGGTIVFVSHDRRFINGLANRVVHVEGGKAESYPGDYEYYHFKRTQQEQEGVAAVAAPAETDGDGLSREARREQKRRDAEKRNELHRRTRSLRERLQAAEGEIATREQKVQGLEVQMADPGLYENAARAQAISAEYAEHKARLVELYDTWADLAARIEGIEEEVQGAE